jgi:hypothetical protein
MSWEIIVYSDDCPYRRPKTGINETAEVEFYCEENEDRDCDINHCPLRLNQ